MRETARELKEMARLLRKEMPRPDPARMKQIREIIHRATAEIETVLKQQ